MAFRAPRHLPLAALLAFALPAFASRPLLPAPPLGTAAASLGGGGAGLVSGVNAVFANPGALSIPAGHQVEAGMMGLAEGLSPYTLFGGRDGAATWSLGWFYDSRLGPYRAGMVAGAAREVLPGASLGAAFHSVGGESGAGVDADAGLLLRPGGPSSLGDWTVVGLAARNLAESGVGQQPDGYRTLRSYAVSAGIRRKSARLLFLPMKEPEAAYEFEAKGLSSSRFAHTFTAAAAFTPAGTMGLRASLRMPQDGAAMLAFGGGLKVPLGSGDLRCGYAFSAAGLATGFGMLSHSMSVNFAFGTRADRQPPWVSVRSDRALAEAEGPDPARVHFRVRASDQLTVGSGTEGGDEFPRAGLEGREEAKAPGEAKAGGRGELREWTLAICAVEADGRRRPVRTYAGRDLPPRLIRWDGRDQGGQPLPAGFYSFRLSARDRAGNLGETAWQMVELAGVEGGVGTARESGPDGAGGEKDAAEGPSREGVEAPGPGALPAILEGDDG